MGGNLSGGPRGARAPYAKPRANVSIEVRETAHGAFMAELRERQRRTVWATGGCSSWYVDDQGRDPTNWPGYTLDYRRRTARVSPDVYEFEPTARAVAAA